MKKIFFFCLLFNVFQGFAQNGEYRPWMGNSKLIVGYYQAAGFADHSPVVGMEQSFEYALYPKFRIGLGTGVNVYPSDLTFPVFGTFKYVQQLKWCGLFVLQSYGMNTRFGNTGFSSHRNYGAVGLMFRLKEKLTIDPELGYLLNWNSAGIISLNLTAGVGLYYSL